MVYRKEQSGAWAYDSGVIPYSPGVQILGASFSVLGNPWKAVTVVTELSFHFPSHHIRVGSISAQRFPDSQGLAYIFMVRLESAWGPLFTPRMFLPKRLLAGSQRCCLLL